MTRRGVTDTPETRPLPGRDDTRPMRSFGGDTVSWHGDPMTELPPADAAPLLSRVGQFVLLERLGAGGMGVVFAAFDEKLERKVAIKLVATHGDERAQQRLLREAQSQARLSHPNVVTIYEVDALPEGKLFLAMELVKGPTLRDWQVDAKRSWQELVPIYVAAGEGLAAAHRGGIVHRDFKPDNVLLGDDGRVRVADFGLAFAAEPIEPVITETSATTPVEIKHSAAAAMAVGQASVPPSDGAPAELALATESQPVRSARKSPALTAAGSLVGTPGYMSPEQFTGADADPRSDQFGFCVALYEALHGERPYADFAFVGPNPEPRRTEPDPSYPRWLWDVLTRGLARDPAARFPSMDALLAELTRNRQRQRRRLIAGLGVLAALVVAAGTASALTGHPPPPCPLATDELVGIWDPPTQQRAAAALLGTATPFAAPMWTSTSAAFDRYAQRWLGAQRAACEATHVRHIQSDDLLDRRMECLAERKRSLAAAVDVLQSHPAQAVDHAGELLASLGEIDLCADTGVLLEQPGHGRAADNLAAARDQALATDIRGRLARAKAMVATGDLAGASTVVREAASLAKGLDDALQAEIRYSEGAIQINRGDMAGAIQTLNQAVDLAVAAHHDELLADVWTLLAGDGVTRDQKPAEIEEWLGQADAWIRRLGHTHDPRRIDADQARGNLQLTQGHAAEALTTMTRALDAGTALWGADDPRMISLHRDRAAIEARLRQPKPAVADAERALALGIAAWGPAHPDVARSRRALGLLYIEQLGDLTRGEHELEQAPEIGITPIGGRRPRP